MTDIERFSVAVIAVDGDTPDAYFTASPSGTWVRYTQVRAALDAAEARERQAVEAEREACAMVAEKMNSHGRFIAAAIRRRWCE